MKSPATSQFYSAREIAQVRLYLPTSFPPTNMSLETVQFHLSLTPSFGLIVILFFTAKYHHGKSWLS